MATTTCPKGWKKLSGKCYLPSKDKLNFQDAINKCKSMKASLAEPMNDKENRNLGAKLSNWYWIGITDQKTEGTFKYVSDGSKVGFISWSKGQPTNKTGNQDCTAFLKGEWSTFNCTSISNYLCQVDAKVECNCNLKGSMNGTNTCEASGQCHCNCAVEGLKCNKCVDFHYGFPNCENNCNANLMPLDFRFRVFNFRLWM